jgi:hypothetical protein
MGQHSHKFFDAITETTPTTTMTTTTTTAMPTTTKTLTGMCVP